MSAFVLKLRGGTWPIAKQYMCSGSVINIGQRVDWLACGQIIGHRNYSADASTGQKVAVAGADLLDRLRQRLDKEVQTGKVVPVFKKALYHADRIAIKDENGEYTYHRIYSGAKRLANEITKICGT